MFFKIICLTVLVFAGVQSAELPVAKCNLEDSACLRTSFQKMMPIFMTGIPDANVEVLDPMEMDDLAFELAGLQFTMTGGLMKGLKNSIVDGVQWDTKKKTFTVDFHMDNSVKGHYTANGRILILPITGDGQIKIRLKRLQMKIKITYDVVKGSNGKDIIKPKKYSFDFDAQESAHYQLTNLFNGNKELSETMLTFLNENWKQIAAEFGRPMIDLASKRIFKNVVNFFEANPIEEITSA
ncbi:circadian clock-controlled protein-like [Spodoptera litura]|uniref:Circadian clock-controlled protein-like n=1 Tax=Spodoptera litura TaxID=69820 RepID=A0A9J7IYN3_SPOLT|nr:circadian clock-controlled protein-like [Spodoptera litura]